MMTAQPLQSLQRKVSPHQRKKKEKQAEISMLMAIDEEQHEEGEKDEMKMYLEDKTKVDSDH